MAMLMNVTTILTAISILTLGGLLYVYIQNLKKIKSKFTFGLFIFALLFLIQNIISLYYYLTMMNYYSPEVEIHVFIFTLLQTIAFITLLKITWE
jgi:heme/copper-type cytochrome/quinol oxidase subunit 4